MQVKLSFFIEFKSELSCPVDIHSVHVVLLSAITEMKYSVPLQTWALIPHISSPLFSLFMLLSSKGASLVELAHFTPRTAFWLSRPNKARKMFLHKFCFPSVVRFAQVVKLKRYF